MWWFVVECGDLLCRMAVLSSRVFYCNGMNHSSRMAYWRDTISKSPAFNRDSDTDHVRWRHIFICVSWQCDKHLKFKDLKILTGYMTYLINEDNHNWAGVSAQRTEAPIDCRFDELIAFLSWQS